MKVDVHNQTDSNFGTLSIQEKPKAPAQSSKCPCSVAQLLAICIPIAAVLLFAAIFVPIYVVNHNDDDDCKTYPTNTNPNTNTNNTNNTNSTDEFDEYEENVVNVTYATFTPKGGYDNIFIFLGGISDVSNLYFDFFRSKNTFIPKGTKIYFLSGPLRQVQFMIDYYNYTNPVPAWFNIDSQANLVPANDFTQAKESLELVLNEIDRIKNAENVDYKKIYLGGFSQGAMMTNYILLNSRHELGGYLAFSGYVFDHDFSSNQVITTLSDAQKQKLAARKDYHILATNSFADNRVYYQLASPTYQYYFTSYTDFRLISFGEIQHLFMEQPIHDTVRAWLKKSMGK